MPARTNGPEKLFQILRIEPIIGNVMVQDHLWVMPDFPTGLMEPPLQLDIFSHSSAVATSRPLLYQSDLGYGLEPGFLSNHQSSPRNPSFQPTALKDGYHTVTLVWHNVSITKHSRVIRASDLETRGHNIWQLCRLVAQGAALADARGPMHDQGCGDTSN